MKFYVDLGKRVLALVDLGMFSLLAIGSSGTAEALQLTLVFPGTQIENHHFKMMIAAMSKSKSRR